MIGKFLNLLLALTFISAIGLWWTGSPGAAGLECAFYLAYFVGGVMTERVPYEGEWLGYVFTFGVIMLASAMVAGLLIFLLPDGDHFAFDNRFLRLGLGIPFFIVITTMSYGMGGRFRFRTRQ